MRLLLPILICGSWAAVLCDELIMVEVGELPERELVKRQVKYSPGLDSRYAQQAAVAHQVAQNREASAIRYAQLQLAQQQPQQFVQQQPQQFVQQPQQTVQQPQQLVQQPQQLVQQPQHLVQQVPQQQEQLVQQVPQQQYVLAQTQQELPAEYLNFLQQIQGQKGVQQVDPSDIQQLLIRSQQIERLQAAPIAKPIPPTTVAQQRRLQQAIVEKSLRQQEERDLQRAQLQTLYKQQSYVLAPQEGGQRLVYQAPSSQEAAQYYQEIPADQVPSQYYSLPDQSQRIAQEVVAQPQAAPAQEAVAPPQEAPQPQVIAPQRLIDQEPERVSYSQVQFGSTKLPRQRLLKIPKQPVVYATPQPEPVYEQPKAAPQTIVYQQPSRELQTIVYEQPRQDLVYQQPQQKDVQGLPQQYLIETSKPIDEPVVSIPKRPTLYYRQQEDVNQLLAAQQSITTAAPSHSSIFVTQSAAPGQEKLLQESAGGRSLTQEEVQALVNAGFQTTPSPELVPAYSVSPQRTYFRTTVKKTQKRIPRPVPLTQDERRALTQAGIRNLYRIEPSESQETPVTYVLALDSQTKTT